MTYDVVVIGGGLAGHCAATTLAQRGWRVTLIEAKTYPFHRVCGEFMSPECVGILDELGVMPAVRDHKPTWMTNATITTPNGDNFNRPLPGAAMGISRYTLDPLLAERSAHVGVDVRTGTRVTSISGNLTDSFTLHMRSSDPIQARAVIAAHGKRTNLDKHLDRAFLKARQPYVGLKMHFHGPPTGATVELHTFPGGYCGLAEVEGGTVNAALLVRQAVFQQAGDIPAFVAWMAEQNPTLGAWLSQATPQFDRWLSVSQVPFVDKALVENEVFMAGDAAGVIAPLAGDGMGMALQGSQMAANHIDRYLRGDLTRDDVLSGYPTAWKREFAGRMRAGRFLQPLMFRPLWISAGLRAANIFPIVGDYFIYKTRDSKAT